MLRHFRLLWAAAAVFSECGGELAEGAEGLEAGWAEKEESHHGAASLDVSTSSDTVGWIGEGSPPPPSRRGRSPAQVRRPCQREFPGGAARGRAHVETVEL